jgi:hypothetical protein
VSDFSELLSQVPTAREVRELLSQRLREVQELRALLKLAQARERYAEPARDREEVPRAAS